jgi:23S rRNA (uracil1939-C5)-methyltransferase
VRSIALELGLTAWDVRARGLLLRHLVLRKSWASGAILADLVTTEEAREPIEPLRARCSRATPSSRRRSCSTSTRGSRWSRAACSPDLPWNGVIHERLGGLAFAISAASFFQTNTPQAERLVELVRAWAAPRAGETVFDLYAGCGVFALSLARSAGPERVIGFELVESAVEDARANAERNDLPGVRFVAGDLALTLAPEQLALRHLSRPDVVVVDPPRAGIHARVLESLRLLEPRRIVHVSCNPRSAVEGLAALVASGYRIDAVQPVDLFPHTPHLECVFRLERVKG